MVQMVTNNPRAEEPRFSPRTLRQANVLIFVDTVTGSDAHWSPDLGTILQPCTDEVNIQRTLTMKLQVKMGGDS